MDDDAPPPAPQDRPAKGRFARDVIYAVGGGFALFAIAAYAFDAGWLRDRKAGEADGDRNVHAALFQPPPDSAMPGSPLTATR